MMANVREELAALEHAQWAAWTKYFLETLGLYDLSREALLRLTLAEQGIQTLGRTFHSTRKQAVFTTEQVDAIMRWRRQIDTPYEDLTEKEKGSDREWADKIFPVLLQTNK